MLAPSRSALARPSGGVSLPRIASPCCGAESPRRPFPARSASSGGAVSTPARAVSRTPFPRRRRSTMGGAGRSSGPRSTGQLSKARIGPLRCFAPLCAVADAAATLAYCLGTPRPRQGFTTGLTGFHSLLRLQRFGTRDHRAEAERASVYATGCPGLALDGRSISTSQAMRDTDDNRREAVNPRALNVCLRACRLLPLRPTWVDSGRSGYQG